MDIVEKDVIMFFVTFCRQITGDQSEGLWRYVLQTIAEYHVGIPYLVPFQVCPSIVNCNKVFVYQATMCCVPRHHHTQWSIATAEVQCSVSRMNRYVLYQHAGASVNPFG